MDIDKQADEALAKVGTRVRLEPVRVENPPDHIMQFFNYGHLPPHLQEISKPFTDLAYRIMDLPRNPERTTALRKLLESKDAAVRARLAK